MNGQKQIEEMAFNLIMATSPLGVKDLTKTFDYNTVATDLYEIYGWRKERQGEWVSVEDKLPQENEKVLAINSDGEIFIATYLVHKVSPSARGYKTWASGLWNGTPTHWQPLPQPPKMKGE